MKTILDLLAKFAEKQSLVKEDRELLQAKFSELSEDDKTEDLTAAIGEATAEPAAEAATEVVASEAEVVETPAPEVAAETVAASEVGDEITIKASEYESLKGLATQASKLIKEKRKDLLNSKVAGMAFSETNKTGVILPKMVNEVTEFALSLSEVQSEKFLSLIGKLQTVAASEIGHDGNIANDADRDVVNFFMEKLHMTEEEALAAAKEAKKEQL